MLDLSSCTDLSSEAFEQLTNDSFPKLEKLDLCETDIKRVDHLSKNLKELYLSSCTKLPPEAFEQLTEDSFSKLEELNLQDTPIKRDLLPKRLQAVSWF